MNNFKFEEATREAIKARIALKAISGGGKTYTALALMTWILGEPGPGMTKRIAVIDTERGSSRRYAKGRPWHFSVCELKSFEPEAFVGAIKAAADAGFQGVIVDSLSHEWAGTGGALEAAIRAITVEAADDEPNGPAESAMLHLERALDPDSWHASAEARVEHAREAAEALCVALADETKRLREAAEAFFGGDFRKPVDDAQETKP